MIDGIIFREKPTRIIQELNLGEQNITQLSRKSMTSYAQTYKIIQKLEKFEVVNSIKSSRDRVIKLTKYGKFIAKCLQDIQNASPN